MERYKLSVTNWNKDYDRVRKTITSGFFTHVETKDKEGYKTLVDNQTIYIYPSSAFFNRAPEWVVYNELVLTKKEFMREYTAIESKLLTDVAGRFYKKLIQINYQKEKEEKNWILCIINMKILMPGDYLREED